MPDRRDPDLRDPAFYADPHATLARLRADDPVHRDAVNDLWALTRYEDVRAASRDPVRFRSGGGVLLGDRDRPLLASQSILYLDPPEHGRHRKLVAPAFHGRRIAELEQRIRALVADLLDDIDVGAPFDAVARLAVPLPLVMIADLLGLPRDIDRFQRWSDAAIAAAAEPTEDNVAVAVGALTYLRDALEERRAAPSDDLISDLLVAEVGGQRLDEAEILGFCLSLLVAGNETTRHLIAGGLLALAERPDEWRRLRTQPSLVTTAVEELLRWVTPFHGFARTTTVAVSVGGVTIPAGAYVLMLYVSANRDESVFGPSAAQLDVGRDPNPHLAFGFGPHYCLGAALARMEARVVLEELLGRGLQPELAGHPVRVASAFVNGLEELPLTLS